VPTQRRSHLKLKLHLIDRALEIVSGNHSNNPSTSIAGDNRSIQAAPAEEAAGALVSAEFCMRKDRLKIGHHLYSGCHLSFGYDGYLWTTKSLSSYSG
jgi:hypothetical protein